MGRKTSTLTAFLNSKYNSLMTTHPGMAQIMIVVVVVVVVVIIIVVVVVNDDIVVDVAGLAEAQCGVLPLQLSGVRHTERIAHNGVELLRL